MDDLATKHRSLHNGDTCCTTKEISDLIVLFGIASLRIDGGIQRLNFCRTEGPPLSRREPVVAERPEAGPDEAADGVADRLAHPPDLAVAALVDHDLQRRSGRRRLGQAGPGRSGPAVV